jgi:hypothetical protein
MVAKLASHPGILVAKLASHPGILVAKLASHPVAMVAKLASHPGVLATEYVIHRDIIVDLVLGMPVPVRERGPQSHSRGSGSSIYGMSDACLS